MPGKQLKDITRQQEQDINNLNLEIKSYEKELSRKNNIFSLPKYKEFTHFFNFEDTREALHHAKSVSKFQSINNIELRKKSIDNVIKKIIKD
jgi:GTPase involved in cell partitioning and DNA repair